MKKKQPYSLSDRLGFGKYRNKSVSYVLENDATYIFWCLTNIPNFTLTDMAMQYAKTCSEVFVGVKSKDQCEYLPYSEGIEILSTIPWRTKYINYMRKFAEDAVITPLNASIVANQPSRQLSFW